MNDGGTRRRCTLSAAVLKGCQAPLSVAAGAYIIGVGEGVKGPRCGRLPVWSEEAKSPVVCQERQGS